MPKINHKGFISIELFAAGVIVFVVGSVLFLVLTSNNATTPASQTVALSNSKSSIKPKPEGSSTHSTTSSTTKTAGTAKSTTTTSTGTSGSSGGSSGGSGGSTGGQSTSYQTIASQFVTAMGNGDKATADSLETSGFEASTSNISGGDTSYYDYCQSQGNFCTPMYVPSNVSSAQITSGVYTPSDSNYSSGYYVQYSENNSSMSAVFDIDLVPHGSSWLVDYVNPKSISVK